ncbi:inositol monophosphatase [Ameyamaea chiangmaiensis NBRC 103196]|uniref:Histidinol-phosphatase n=1 Tax=Ameyamaea chiangmaiensis TaxID=442969 RepID=A0A850P312_9PROT|nr:histidinol-phosphatase [Ameyamaea chiangmaiensis]MBS4073675.1 histidinol-phosphatase [Ameyamaea chiangmaiensis]NVN39057.1 histidinol-phosphatase [Ameyamaea chiangmaiensis]GBQ68848.1 inositol monophosphatase [Ameyamaea chiangmaiensis NBRC 103196]
MTTFDSERFLKVAEAAADVAGAVIRPLFRSRLAVDDKSDDSPVTIADRTAERALRAVIAERLPDHGILGEEFGHERPEASWCWVLDPIDGTRAFVTGRPSFGTLIALLHEGRPVLGVIDQPMTGERWIGVSGAATRYRGPWGDERAQTRPCPHLDAAELSCTSPEMLAAAPSAHWPSLQGATRRTTWGGDCYTYGLLALGHVDVVAECGMKIWDWAALVPVVEGAGGRITDWSGAPLSAQGDGSVLAVGDPALLAPATALLSRG